MAAKKKTPKKKPVKKATKKNRGCYLDQSFKEWELRYKKTGKKITNVIFADVKLRALKRWKKGKDHMKGTQFIEDVDLEWVKKK